MVKGRCRRGSTSLLAKGKGVWCEVESIGALAAKPRPDEQEPYKRLSRSDELAQPSEILGSHADGGVYGGGWWRFALLREGS